MKNNYKIDFSLVVLDKNIVEHFGKPLTNPSASAARNKLFDFVFSRKFCKLLYELVCEAVVLQLIVLLITFDVSLILK